MALVYTKEASLIKMTYTHEKVEEDEHNCEAYVETKLFGTEEDFRESLRDEKIHSQNMIKFYKDKIDKVNEKVIALNKM